MKLNYFTLLIFAPVLILTGLLGFLLPNDLLSNAPKYNYFHIFFGILGLVFVISKKENLIRIFNIGFGAIDIYQAIASFLNLFPQNYFQWKIGDDILHILIGGILIMVGITKKRI